MLASGRWRRSSNRTVKPWRPPRVIRKRRLGHVQRHQGEAPDAGRCPVCEQSVNASALRASIAERLRRMEQLTRLLDDLRAADSEVGRSEARAEERRATLEIAGQALASAT